jgi:chemotaxis protein methyltransferase CheR
MMHNSDAVLTTPELKPSEFEMIRDLAQRTFGLELRNGKERLVAARLGKHLKAGGFRTFRHYYDRVKADSSGELLIGLIDALTTNHTGFLREPAHFDYLRELICTEYRNRSRLDIWSAAGATGEEPYTLLFSALSTQESRTPLDVRILASDITTRALSVARKGAYTRDRVAVLPPAWVTKFFHRPSDTVLDQFQVRADLRARMSFQRINLIECLTVNSAFPVIFCRNVMIYFNKATQTEVVQRLSAKLEPGGYLFVGHSESLSGINHNLRYVRPAVYQKPA